jgi:hypothetical protein
MDKKIISYLKAGRLLHLVTLTEVLIFCFILSLPGVRSWLTGNYFFLKILALSPAITLPLISQLDARSRYQNYKLIKDNLHIYGFQKRLLKPFIKSRCQRDAIKAAAGELGILHLCTEYFKDSGYRWYHLLPDVVFDNPSVLRTKNFWSTTLFEKKYHPKVNFEKINLSISFN